MTRTAKAGDRRRTPTAPSTDDERFAAVQRRDPAADGAFVYAVATTGVYCRPSCPSRQARRQNIAFHDTSADAEAAGFRPCKRCKPNGAPGHLRAAAIVAAACRHIESAEDMPGLQELARAAGLSPHHFHRMFKAATGITPKAYAAQLRDRRLRDGLASGSTITAAIYEAGFGTTSRFYASASKSLGMSPRQFRAGGAGETLCVAAGVCSLGAILVAASSTGIAAILLGDDPAALMRDLERRFPKACLVTEDAVFGDMVAQVVSLVEAPGTGIALPLDIRGTAFQRRVWEALSRIPAGTTASYADIAADIGNPKAVRAVAAACAANPIAVAIPCHRVVGRDGALTGYRWGVERKRALLKREGGR